MQAGAARRIPVRLRVSRRAALVALVGSGWKRNGIGWFDLHVMLAPGVHLGLVFVKILFYISVLVLVLV